MSGIKNNSNKKKKNPSNRDNILIKGKMHAQSQLFDNVIFSVSQNSTPFWGLNVDNLSNRSKPPVKSFVSFVVAKLLALLLTFYLTKLIAMKSKSLSKIAEEAGAWLAAAIIVFAVVKLLIVMF